jgi:predicted HTH domain antitoxin
MNLEVNIPDEILNSDSEDVSRDVLEAIALEGFRSGQLGTAQVRRLLGLASRNEVHEFLWKHGIPWVDYSVEDAERERKLLMELLP